ncbi:MAG: AMP-binding protein [Chloroflexi bacterium]|nr:AMP-binding protein [Chloroflexota bacterium]
MVEALSESERFPLLTAEGRRLLHWLHENEFAPRYNHHCGDRLTTEGLRRVIDFENELHTASNGWQSGTQPAWLADFAAMCFDDVPFYRRYGAMPADFSLIPTCERADLSREPWLFVPDSQSLDDLIVYCTSGTTGQPLDVLSHPNVSSMYLPLLRFIVGTRGVKLEGSAGRVAVALVCFQKSTITYASISTFLNQAGLIKINLNPNDWRDLNDRARFLDECNPEIYTGDPISFAELMTLPLRTRPKALVSTAMMLTAGLREKLETHFSCPVIDLYSMNESGPIAVANDEGHAVLPHCIYVEILRDDGTVCAPGERGEITLTGGFNPFLPLLRYRTGDHAAMQFRGRLPMLVGLEGRAPVVFRSTSGRRINNIDISTMLKPFALTQFALHQFIDGSLRLRVRGALGNPAQLRDVLIALFGAQQRLVIESVDSFGDKVMQYTSDYAE